MVINFELRCFVGRFTDLHQQFKEESGIKFSKLEEGLLQFHISNLEYACGGCLDKVSAMLWDQNEDYPQFHGPPVLLQDGYTKIIDRLAEGVNVVTESEVSLKKKVKINSALWVIFHVFLLSADFFQNQLFRKILSGIPSECQTVWIQFRPDILSHAFIEIILSLLLIIASKCQLLITIMQKLNTSRVTMISDCCEMTEKMLKLM